MYVYCDVESSVCHVAVTEEGWVIVCGDEKNGHARNNSRHGVLGKS